MMAFKLGFASAILIGLASPASAAAGCTVSASPAAFGTYNVFSGVATDTTSTIQTVCSALVAIGISYTLTLSIGGGTDFAHRTMAGGSSSLVYQLYTNSGRSAVWGDGTGGTSTVTDGYLLSAVTPVIRNYTVYGRIPMSQTSLTPGPYSDSVLVTLTY